MVVQNTYRDRIEVLEKQMQTRVAGEINLAKLLEALVNALEIDYSLSTQDEEDRKSVSLWGVSAMQKQRSQS